VLDGLACPHIWTPYVQMEANITLFFGLQKFGFQNWAEKVKPRVALFSFRYGMFFPRESFLSIVIPEYFIEFGKLVFYNYYYSLI